jgi:hypothetical protein
MSERRPDVCNPLSLVPPNVLAAWAFALKDAYGREMHLNFFTDPRKLLKLRQMRPLSERTIGNSD